MDVKAVMKNLKKKGFRETLKIRRKNVELRRLLEEYRIVLNRYKDAAEREDEKKLQEALCSLLEEYRYAFQKRPFMGVSTSQYKEFMGTLFSVQQILDEQMHRIIWKYCGNEMIGSIIRSYDFIVKRIQISNMQYHRRKSGTLLEMGKIILALANKDVDAAVKAMEIHIGNIKKTLVESQ